MSAPPADAGPVAAPHARAAACSSWRSRGAWGLLVVVTALGFLADVWTKDAAFGRVADGPVVVQRERVLASNNLTNLVPAHAPVTVVPHLLEFTLVLNRGAVFGIGAGKRWFFVGFTVLALGFGLWMFGAWTRPRDHAAHAAIGLLLAGGLGNLYDRLAYACVRDFIHPLPGVMMPFGSSLPGGAREVWPYVSNVADLFLLIGIGILIVHVWRTGRRAGSAEPRP